MKKTYINPEMEVIKIASQSQMLAGSAARFDNSGSGELDLSTESYDESNGDIVL